MRVTRSSGMRNEIEIMPSTRRWSVMEERWRSSCARFSTLNTTASRPASLKTSITPTRRAMTEGRVITDTRMPTASVRPFESDEALRKGR